MRGTGQSANKMIFGDIVLLFLTTLLKNQGHSGRAMENLFHTAHSCIPQNGTVATDSEVSFQKSDFDPIPVETRIAASKHSRRITLIT